MIISLNWLKKYVDIKIPTDELVELIGARLVEVEQTIDLAPKYAGIKIVEVKSAEKITGSDHLTKCMIWDGKSEAQVVCGAPNVRTGMLAVWLAPGVVLPETYDSQPLVLSKRKLMGVESNGMLAALDELGLGADHEGIVEIDPGMAKPGDDFAEKFELNDILLDIENKSLTHRPDCFGVIGFAREVAGILGQPAGDFLNDPDKNGSFAKLGYGEKSDLTVKIADPELCPRYQAIVLDGFHDKPAKYLNEMTILLTKSGMRAISPIVDVTNYLMLLTGQPLHAFDYDKLVAVGGKEKPEIIVRAAQDGEKLELLDGKEIELSASDIVITSNNVPVALAGAMGGKNTDIDEDTRRIVIEAATFNIYNLRGTQFRHGIFSEAITRFTKGQPPALTDPVIDECARILTTEHGMEIIGAKVDTYPAPVKTKAVKISAQQINGLLGSDYSYAEIEKTLRNVGFEIEVVTASAAKQSSAAEEGPGLPRRVNSARNDSRFLNVTPPWWRTDIHIPEDIIEEVGRLNGFDNIPAVLPKRDYQSVNSDKLGGLKSKIRNILSSGGANEILTYSFVNSDLLEKSNQDPTNSYQIVNSISPDLQFVRQTLMPSLLDKMFQNYDEGYEKFALYELNKVSQKRYGLTDEKVPVEKNHLSLVLIDPASMDVFYVAKVYAEKVLRTLGIIPIFRPFQVDTKSTIIGATLEPKQAAFIHLADVDEPIGVVGVQKQSVLRNFGLPPEVAGFEIDLDRIIDLIPGHVSDYVKSSRFPSAKRDMTFQVAADLPYAKLENLVRAQLEQQNLWFKLLPVSIYQGDDKSTKNISFKLTFASLEKTLDGKEIAALIDGISEAAAGQLKAKII